VLGASESGWWYGYKVTGFDMSESGAVKGFFPSNYVKTLQSEDPDQIEREKEEAEKQAKYLETQAKLASIRQQREKEGKKSSGSGYLDYANATFADREQLTIYHRRQQLGVKSAPTMTNEEKEADEILKAYNKFGIGNANPTKAILKRTNNKLQTYQQSNVNYGLMFRDPLKIRICPLVPMIPDS
jgi:hypothetical protein